MGSILLCLLVALGLINPPLCVGSSQVLASDLCPFRSVANLVSALGNPSCQAEEVKSPSGDFSVIFPHDGNG